MNILLELITPKFLILYAFVLSGLYIHFRGRERFGFLRQLTDHSTFMAPYNCFLYLFSRVPNKPILRVEDFPEIQKLRENWETIRDEAKRLYEGGQIKKSEAYDDLAFNSFFKSGWTRFYLKWYDDILPSARQLCPKTVELVEQIPAINAAMFTSLAPKSRLVRHRDPFAGSVRYHLGLMTPNSDECQIFIDGTPYSWRDGEDIMFDETYIHVAENKTETNRVILFCDVERPLNNPVARGINRFVNRNVVKVTATKNEEGEKVGFFNKAFAYIYRMRLVAKSLKKKNRRLYYALKYILIFGAIFLVFGLPLLRLIF